LVAPETFFIPIVIMSCKIIAISHSNESLKCFRGSVWTLKMQTKLSYSIYHWSTLIYNMKVTCKLGFLMFFSSLHAHTRLLEYKSLTVIKE
jgi:hypothetical protein